jgi:hypothetical protein
MTISNQHVPAAGADPGGRGFLPSGVRVSLSSSPGCVCVRSRLNVRRLHACPCQDCADLFPVGVPAVQRLRHQKPGVGLVGPLVEDDHALGVEGLGQELLPALLRLLDPRVELVDVDFSGSTSPGSLPPAQSTQGGPLPASRRR